MTSHADCLIRPMQVEDIPRVAEIANSLPDAPRWPAAAYEAALNPNSEPRRIALVAEAHKLNSAESETPESRLSSGLVVGFVVASLVAGEAELESIAVVAAAQRRGVAGQILSQLFAALREHRVTRINLEVRASNRPALAFYRRHGFKEAGRRIGYYADPVEDAVLMDIDLGGPNSG
jgi:ribosomal-protein-alanine N-acetyltransferase